MFILGKIYSRKTFNNNLYSICHCLYISFKYTTFRKFKKAHKIYKTTKKEVAPLGVFALIMLYRYKCFCCLSGTDPINTIRHLSAVLTLYVEEYALVMLRKFKILIKQIWENSVFFSNFGIKRQLLLNDKFKKKKTIWKLHKICMNFILNLLVF